MKVRRSFARPMAGLLVLIAVMTLAAGCATAEKSKYFRHLAGIVKQDAPRNGTALGAFGGSER